jgi:hypothetical protein
MAKHHVIDYDTFLPRLVAGLRKAWTHARRQHPDETFYMFGICTDSDITDLFPFSNTEEQYAENGNPSYPSDKWLVPEKAYEHRSKDTSELAVEVNRYVFEDHSKDPKGAFAERKARLLEIFEKALVQLDAEGFFGSGKKRNQVLLKIDLGDCGEDEQKYMMEVIKRINPVKSTTEFLALAEEEKDDEEQKVIGAATEFLIRQKQSFANCTGAYRFDNERITMQLAKLLRLKLKPEVLWEVFFERELVAIVTKIRKGKNDPGNSIVVVVDPETGKCAIRP